MTTWNHIANKHIDNFDHTAELSKKITSGNTILIPDAEGDLIPFTIREDRLYAGVNETLRQASCVHLYYELADGPVSSYNRVNDTPATAIIAALTGTRWELGNVAPSLSNLTKDFEGILQNPLQRLRQIEKEYEARLKFHVTLGGPQAKTIDRYLVDLEEIEDTFSGKRFEFGRDLQNVDIRVDRSQIKTALIGTALGEEIDLVTGDPLPLTFESVEWKKDAGDPANKPLGQNWVGDEIARELYGIYDPATGEMRHRFGVYESEAESPETLIDATWLIGNRYHFRPRVTVEGRVADLERAVMLDIATGDPLPLSHEKIRLGQIAYVIAREKGLLAAVDVRVTRIERYLKAPENTVITLGDPILLGSDYTRDVERKADWKEKRRRKLDRGRGPATVTVAHETTSSAPYYASFVVRAGQMLNDVFGDILSLLPATGGQIVFAEGTYPYDGNLLIDRDNVTIKGQGEGTRLVLKAGTNKDVKGIYANGRTGLEIADFAMDGQKDQQSENYKHNGVTFTGCQHSKIEGLKVHYYLDRGIRLEGCEEIEVLSNTLNDNNFNLYGNECKNLTVTSNNARWSRANGMYFQNVIQSVISGNLCNETIYRGVGNNIITGIALAAGCNSNAITDNICNENYGFGLSVYGANHTISGNQCNGNWYGGISLISTERCIVSNNTCCDNKGDHYDGIEIQGPTKDCVLQNNTCTGNSRYGIYIGFGATGHFISNNDCQNNEVGGIRDQGTNTRTAAGNRT